MRGLLIVHFEGFSGEGVGSDDWFLVAVEGGLIGLFGERGQM